MGDDRHREGPPRLTEVLSRLRTDHPEQRALADVIAAIARTGAQVGSLVAAYPLASSAAGSPAGPNPGADEAKKALDVRAGQLFVAALSGGEVAALCCEGTAGAISLTPGATLAVALDAIDGSSNVDINATTGSSFAVLPVAGFADDPVRALLQPGRDQVAAGIIVYGPSTVMALTWGDGTDIYALDPQTATFFRVRHRVALPADAQEYAVNASNARHWGPGIQAYVSDLVNGSLGPRERDFTMHWLASLVAETYRILLRGGIFLYPSDERPAYRQGRIRLVYGANPVAFLCEQAGGAATDGVGRILDLQPTDLHQRTPLVFGSRNKVQRVRRYLLDPPTRHEDSPLFSQRGLFRR